MGPAHISTILPQATRTATGATVFPCQRGHEHDFLSIALACDMTAPLGIPKRFLGSERAEIANTQDAKAWNERISGRGR